MQEIEVKYEIPTYVYAGIREHITGSRRPADDAQDYQCDKYFDMGSSGLTLRIRTDKSGSYVTFKGRKELLPGGVSTRSELEPRIEDGSSYTWQKLFEGLGFVMGSMVEKQREAYKFKDATVYLDHVISLGKVFVEIEVVGIDVADAAQKISEVVGALGLESYAPETRSYIQLVKQREMEDLMNNPPTALIIDELAFLRPENPPIE